jgi:hypothetical protein
MTKIGVVCTLADQTLRLNRLTAFHHVKFEPPGG